MEVQVPPSRPFKKLLIVGDKGVGKTSFLLRFSEIPIAGIEFGVKTIELGNEIELLDFATADGILLVYDVTNELSFEHIIKCMHCFPKEVKKILVGNKADDVSKRAVRERRGQVLAGIYNSTFWETSVKTDKNVKDVFFALA